MRTQTEPTPRPRLSDDQDEPIVPPPATMTVQHDHKPILFTPDGKALVRKAGF